MPKLGLLFDIMFICSYLYCLIHFEKNFIWAVLTFATIYLISIIVLDAVWIYQAWKLYNWHKKTNLTGWKFI